MKVINSRTSQRWNFLFHLYLMLTSAFGIAVFLITFFPVKHDTFDSNNTYAAQDESNFNSSTSASSGIIGRLVFMVIDALRSDFILSPQAQETMPYLSALLHQGEACAYTATVNPPTVTMPRIKAMVTGTVPGFVDIILNLGSAHITEDNFVRQLVTSGRKVVFYGDDTWLKLFPNTFLRSEGTTSFFVSDYTEVDVNVTRHLSTELDQQDWSLMILHYLGLDHIGHLVGPRSSLVPPKLQEMDAVVQQIHQALLSQRPDQRDVLVMCGDHGMKDTGGHGGASHEETHVAVVVVGLPCVTRIEEIAQLDLAPTLSVLLGLPVPQSSVGTLVPELISGLSPEQRLRVLHDNAAHLATLLAASITSSQESLLTEAVRLHESWLTQGSTQLYDRVEALYMQVSGDMSAALASSHSHFDLHTLALCYVLVLQCLALLIASLRQCCWPRVTVSHCALMFLSYVGVNACMCALQQDTTPLVCDVGRFRSLVLPMVIMSILAYNTMLLYHSRAAFNIKVPESSWQIKLLLLGCVLHCLSLGSSSLVEEEHQVWYFFWTSLLLLVLPNDPWRVCMALVLHRVARKWNQTGDKWASLPDVEDWLAERKTATSLVFLSGLLTLAVILCRNQSAKHKAVTVIACCCIYCYRAAIGAVNLPHFQPLLSHQGWLEARVFGCCLLLLLARGVLAAAHARNTLTASIALHDCWLLAVSMLRRPADVILLPVQLFYCSVISRVLHNTSAVVVAHIWLGWVAFFYQGNSNSLASVDVAAGYVGMLDYQPSLIALMLLAHTYSAPILSHLALFRHLATCRASEVAQGLKLVSVLRLLPMCLYLGIVSIQREHLFIWSVFAPKLLYEATATLVSLLSLCMCLLCIYSSTK